VTIKYFVRSKKDKILNYICSGTIFPFTLQGRGKKEKWCTQELVKIKLKE